MSAQTLSVDDVRAIAELAKLDLSDAEVVLYTEQLSQILGYFTLLQEVDTSQVDKRASVIPLTTIMRADEPIVALDPALAVANAPDSDENQFKVSAVLGDE